MDKVGRGLFSGTKGIVVVEIAPCTARHQFINNIKTLALNSLAILQNNYE